MLRKGVKMMKSVEVMNPKQTVLQNIQSSRPYLVWLMIWGIQAVLASTLEFIGQWLDVAAWQSIPLWIALAASAVVLGRDVRLGVWSKLTIPAGPSVWAVIMLIVAVWTLGYVHAADTSFIPLLKSFIVAAALAQLGVWLGKPILYIGIWQFVLTLVVATHYLGLASVALGGAGGLSMIALGWMLYIGNKQSEGVIQ